MPDLTTHYRTREVTDLLAPFLPQPALPQDAIPILRAAGIPETRVGGALLWSRDAVAALLADLRRSRDRADTASPGDPR